MTLYESHLAATAMLLALLALHGGHMESSTLNTGAHYRQSRDVDKGRRYNSQGLVDLDLSILRCFPKASVHRLGKEKKAT